MAIYCDVQASCVQQQKQSPEVLVQKAKTTQRKREGRIHPKHKYFLHAK